MTECSRQDRKKIEVHARQVPGLHSGERLQQQGAVPPPVPRVKMPRGLAVEWAVAEVCAKGDRTFPDSADDRFYRFRAPRSGTQVRAEAIEDLVDCEAG